MTQKYNTLKNQPTILMKSNILKTLEFIGQEPSLPIGM